MAGVGASAGSSRLVLYTTWPVTEAADDMTHCRTDVHLITATQTRHAARCSGYSEPFHSLGLQRLRAAKSTPAADGI